MAVLPMLKIDDLSATRDYLQEASKILGKLQQAFLPKSKRDWHYGLEITMRGISTQTFKVNGQPTRALLDLVRHKLRLDNLTLGLREHPPALLFKEVETWLSKQGIDKKLDEPVFKPGVVEYDLSQAEKYAEALWWMEKQFRTLKNSLNEGISSPILLYPHHFDLSLVWYPFDDEQQIAIGFSSGDTVIKDPYIYITTFPEATKLKSIAIPAEAYWQIEGFEGILLPYAQLQNSRSSEELFKSLVLPAFL